MKNVILHQVNTPLGSGLQYLDKNQRGKYIYIIPSMTLIQDFKDILIKDYNIQSKIEFMTFDQMMRVFFANNRKTMTPQEQELVVKRAIEQVDAKNGFSYFKKALGKTGWIQQIEVWIGEIKRAGVTSDELKLIWNMHSDKYQELALIYEAYQNILERYKLNDHEEPYFSYLKNDTSCSDDLLEYTGIITEQFYDFSPIQMRVLSELGNSGLRVDVNLPVDFQRNELFNWSFKTLNYLKQFGFNDTEIPIEHLNQSAKSLKHAMNSLFSVFPDILDNDDSIEVITVSGINQEVEMVAAEIKSLVINKGINLNDIAIVSTELAKYEAVVSEIMGKSGIKVRLSKKEFLIHNPFVQSIISVIKAFRGNKNDWVSMLYSPYISFKKQIDPARFMMILRELSFPMSLDKWQERFEAYLNRNESFKEELLVYDKVMRHLIGLILQMPTNGSNKDFVNFINIVERELGFEENIRNYFLTNPTNENFYRDLKAYDKWQELKSELIEIDDFLDEGESFTIWNWLNSLILSCEKTEYSFLQGKKTGVYFLNPNQIRGRNFKVVFVLGLTEGNFPRAIRNDWLMPDNERFLLRKHGFYLNSTIDYEIQQKYQFFQSVNSAKEKLYLVYAEKTEDGKEQLRSFFVDDLLGLFNINTIKFKQMDISDIIPKSWHQCVYDDQLINKVYSTIYSSPSTIDNEALARFELVNKKYPKQVLDIDRGIESEKERWSSLKSSYDGIIQTKKVEINALITPKVWSTTKLNNASKCRFAYFAEDILKLSKWEEQEESLNPLEKGDILHNVLVRFFAAFRNGEQIFDPNKELEYLELIDDLAENEWQLFKNNEIRYLDTALSEIDWHRIKQNLKQIVKHEVYWRKNASSYFYPSYLEYSFGMPIDRELLNKGEIDPSSISEQAEIKLESSSIYLRGKIDRVDINDQGQFVIYDYKSGGTPDNKEIIEGINLQLPIYLFALQAIMGFDLDKALGASFYTRGTKNDKGEYADNRNKGIWRSQFLEEVGLSSRIGSKIDEEKWTSWLETIKKYLDELLEKLKSGDFAVMPTTECPVYCSYKQICRYDEKRIKVKSNGEEVK